MAVIKGVGPYRKFYVDDIRCNGMMLRGAKKSALAVVVESFGSQRQAGGRPWHANEVTDPNGTYLKSIFLSEPNYSKTKYHNFKLIKPNGYVANTDYLARFSAINPKLCKRWA